MTHESFTPPAPDSGASAARAPVSLPAHPRLLVIFNPVAGGSKRRRLRRTLDRLRALGCKLDLRETRAPGDAERFAAAACPTAHDAVIAAGGDGTINEVVNGLVAGPGGDRLPLGIIPLGTANVLALEMGLSLTPAAVARAIVEGRRRSVALAEAGGRHVLLMAGAGIDAHVVENVNAALKRRTGKLAYVAETLKQALKYRFPTVELTVDGARRQAATAVVCNGRLYGGPFVAAPDGDLTRAALFVVLLTRKGLWSVVRYGIGLALSRLPRMDGVEILCARKEVVISAPEGAPVQADGDLLGRVPVRIRAAGRRVDILFPA